MQYQTYSSKVQNRNPFVDSVSKRPLHLVIAAVEFSHLTDGMRDKKWPKHYMCWTSSAL